MLLICKFNSQKTRFRLNKYAVIENVFTQQNLLLNLNYDVLDGLIPLSVPNEKIIENTCCKTEMIRFLNFAQLG